MSGRPLRFCQSLTTGRPSVMVPVLSKTTVVTLAPISSAVPLRMKMPRRAAAPVPAMIAVGVARPSAHGQAISTTAMAWASACVAGAPPSSQPPAVTPAMPMTPGTKTEEIRSASFWTGSLALCASSTMRTICASTVSWPTAVARSVSAPFWFMQPPITLSPAALPTGMLSPVSIDFVDRRTAGDHFAVGRHPLAGPHQQDFAGDDGFDIDDHLDAVAEDGGGRRLQFDELADRFAGLALGTLFQIAAEQHEGDDARRRLEIEEVRAPVRQQAGQAVEVGGAGAERDQGVHVGAAVARQLDGLLEERQAGAEDDRGGQHELQQAQAVVVRHGHAQDHQRRGQRGGGEEALARLFAQDLFAFDEEAPLGERIHRARRVAEAIDQRENRIAVELAVDGTGGRGKIDGGVLDARIALQRQLDQRRAGGAGHSLDGHRTVLQRTFGDGFALPV